jgi:hypothetical protein
MLAMVARRAQSVIAKNAIANDYFAVAQFSAEGDKDPAFQASSPKTFRPPLGAAYFFGVKSMSESA